ncbi:hypothetical protein BJ322DRAFT_215073 [Thelephora terrestris]|uniref:Uncharacterized protein n=1 Tax=Thelephora terrestris TaxID=56493 RepID=A0A9P6HA14_9AGAM|nr:hypothetical protein BJ322DRAFT_215073 [Thelephora terrestris]
MTHRALVDTGLVARFFGIGLVPKNHDPVSKNYDLFHTIMQLPAPFTDSEEKWRAARLTIHGAYKWDEWMPYVGDPQHILDFLNHHFELAAVGGPNQDEPIQNALRALAYAYGPDTLDALNKFDPTDPSFVRGILYVFQSDRPFELRKAALFFLALIGDKWFNAPDPIMDPDQMRSLYEDWSSAVGDIEHTSDVQNVILTVLLGMINSQNWRPYIAPKDWNLLQYIASVPDDSQPLKRCLDNSELIDAISEVENPHARVLWLEILWLKYGELIPEIQERLQEVAREVAMRGEADFNTWLSAVESELGNTEDALMQYDALSTDPVFIAKRIKVDSLVQARRILLALRNR